MILLILATQVARADTTLSYAEALQRALEANPTLRSAGADVDAAEGALLAAKGTFDPSLSADLGLQSSTSEGTAQFGEYSAETRTFYDDATVSWFAPTGTSLTLGWKHDRGDFRYVIQDFDSDFSDAQVSTQIQATVTQALLQGWRMSYNLQAVRQARQDYDAAEATLASKRQKALSDVASAYWSLWEARRQVEVTQQALDLSREEQKNVRARVEAGALAPIEQLRVDALVVSAESDLVTADNAERAASDTLAVLIGQAPGTTYALATDPAEPTPVTLDEDKVVETALGNNPDLAVLKLAETAAGDDLRDAKHARLPELDLVGSYAQNGYDAQFSASLAEMFSGALPEWGVGLELSAPLGNRVARGKADARGAALQSATIDREAYERTLSADVRAQVRAIQTAAAKARLAQANADLAEQTLAAEKALQEVGRAIQKDVLDAIQKLDEARATLEASRADYALAIVELERLKGSL